MPKPRRPGNGNGAQSPAEAAQEAGLTVIDWLDERTSLSGVTRWTLFRKVPRGTNWYYTLGTATLFAFLNQAVTGVFLAMYYRPDAAGGAYESVRHINDSVFLGQLVHAMHKWGASVMIILIFLHMARVFFFGAYKYPRELTWVIGSVILILVLMMGLTGYLLPLDNRAYWATVVATNIQAGGPFIGPYLANFLIGGTDFGATTLSRFYAIHMLLIPGLIIVLIGAHLYLVAKLGTTAPPYMKPHDEPELMPKAEV
jgi:menaquinol-cytochrome c reductase cytochrome b subunit